MLCNVMQYGRSGLLSVKKNHRSSPVTFRRFRQSFIQVLIDAKGPRRLLWTWNVLLPQSVSVGSGNDGCEFAGSTSKVKSDDRSGDLHLLGLWEEGQPSQITVKFRRSEESPSLISPKLRRAKAARTSPHRAQTSFSFPHHRPLGAA